MIGQCFRARRPHGLPIAAMLLAGIALVACSKSGANDTLTVLKPRFVINGMIPLAQQNMIVAMRGERIEYVGPSEGYAAPKDAVEIDLAEKTVMPGLINAHLHLLFNGQCSHDAPVSLGQTILNTKVTLAEGVTTVADLSSPWSAISGLKKWLECHPDRGPRVLAAGPFLTAPGSYPFDWMPEEFSRLDGAIALRDTVEAREVVNNLADKGVDFIKIGIVSKSFNEKPLPSLSDEIVRAVADAAHAHKLRVLTHAIYADDWARAVNLPIDALVHNSLEAISHETLDAVVQRRLPVVPTLLVWSAPMERPMQDGFLDQDWVRERLEPGYIEDLRQFKKRLEESGEIMPWNIPGVKQSTIQQGNVESMLNLLRLHRAGATIGVGTDAAVCYNLHGSPAWEMERMARAGMNFAELIIAATQGSAKVLGIEDDVGTLEAGKRADILILDENPLGNLQNLRKVHAVVKAGTWYDPPELKSSWWERLTLAWAMRGILFAYLF